MAKKELQEAMLWQKERNGVRCSVCARKCFISKEKRGYCQVRKNVGNKLYTLNFGKIVSINTVNIEKNPLFHFYPNSNVLFISSPGNNFPDQTQIFTDKNQENVIGKPYDPEDIVDLAEKDGCKAITYNGTEPFMFFEFVFRTAKLAQRSNIKNAIVTNGFLTEEAIKKITKYIDAFTVNLIASGDPDFYEKFLEVSDTEPLFDVLRQIKKRRAHLEITNLVIPQVGDKLEQCRKLAQWVSSELNPEVPFHLVQFYPDKRFPELPPTPVATLEAFADEVRKTGLRYIYIDNVPNHPDNNTYCYNCREVIVERKGLAVKKNKLIKGRCPNCGVRINILTE